MAITAYRGSAPVITSGVTHGLLNLGDRCCSGSRDCGVSFHLTVPRALAVTLHWDIGQIRVTAKRRPAPSR